MTSVTRPPLGHPIIESNEVRVYHPKARSIVDGGAFLELPRLEYLLEDGQIVEVAGVHFGTLVTACMIFSQNQQGYLQELTPGSPDPPDPPPRFDLTNTGWDTIMRGEAYVWYVNGTSPEDYTICPNFRSWTFIPEAAPEPWTTRMQGSVDSTGQNIQVSASNMSAGVYLRDGTCCVTGLRANLENAHIVPKAEAEWFERNGLHFYNGSAKPSTQLTQDTRNGIALNTNYRSHFDYGRFAIVPKAGVFAVQLLQPPSSDLLEIANREVSLRSTVTIQSVAVEFLYCRLAYNIMSSGSLYRFKIKFPNLLLPPRSQHSSNRHAQTSQTTQLPPINEGGNGDDHADEDSAMEEPLDDDQLQYEAGDDGSDHLRQANTSQSHHTDSNVARSPNIVSEDTFSIDKTSKQYKVEYRLFRERFPGITEDGDRILGDYYGGYPGSSQLWAKLEPIQAEMRNGIPIGNFLNTGGPEFQPHPEVARQPDSATEE